MVNRMLLLASLTGLVTGALACGGSPVSSITSLPSSDPVAADSAQLCSDTASYIVSNLSSLVPFICSYSAAGATASTGGTSGGGTTTSNSAQCQTSFNDCTSEANAVLQSSGGQQQEQQLTTQLVSDCDFTHCTATVGQVAQCIADYVGELQSVSNSVTAQSACSGAAPQTPQVPASCLSLPSDCDVFESSVNVSMGSSGGTVTPIPAPDAG
jgi:hypothetical protein